jgi:hypothetical protein
MVWETMGIVNQEADEIGWEIHVASACSNMSSARLVSGYVLNSHRLDANTKRQLS